MRNKSGSKFILPLLGLSLALGTSLTFIPNKKSAEEVKGYSQSTLPTTIYLNDTTPENIRAYYSSLNSLDTTERQGSNLLKNLKTILKKDQKYYSYDSGDSIWDMYCIVDRDWKKSPASSLPAKAGTFDSTENKITGYNWGKNSSTYENPYLHVLYYNRDKENVVQAYGEHSSTTSPAAVNREHIWPKGAGFDGSGQGGARGDIMHLWASNVKSNNIHNNYYYGYVSRTGITNDIGASMSQCTGNYLGTSATLGGTTKVFEPQDSDKGDIARAVFYMAARYNYLSGSDSDGINNNNPNLTIVNTLSTYSDNGYTSSTTNPGKLGILTDLLAWHHADPVDEFEIHRNNLCYTNFTNNRNPFVDFPEWVDYIWGTVSYDGINYQSYSSDPTGYATPSSDIINGYKGGSSDPVSVTGVTLEKESTSVEVGGSEVLSYSIAPSNATNQEVTWTSSNTNVATVSASGCVEGVAEGSATITVRTSDGGFTDTCTVTVTAASGSSEGTEEGSVTAASGILPNWTASGTGSAYSDGSVKFDGSGDNVYKTDIFSGEVASGMTSLSVTLNCKYNTSSGDANANVYTVEAIDSSGNVIASSVKTGNSIIPSSYGDVVFEMSGDLSGCTGIRFTYTTKGANNIALKSVSWSATYSSGASEPTVSSIAVKTAPTKLTYTVGDDFAPAGLVITVTYSDASTADVSYSDNPDSFEFDPADDLQTTDTSVTISYGGKTCTQNITVNASKTLSSISISNYTTSYYVGDTFSFDGVCTATYSDSSSGPVTPTSVTSPNMSTAGEKTITVSYTYGGTTKSAQYTITVEESGSTVPGNYTWNLAINSTSSASATNLTWTADCATMSADKNESSTATNNYYPGTSGKSYTSTRFYKNSLLTITPRTNYEVTSVVFTATSAEYATALRDSTWTNATATASSSTVTITPTDGNSAFYALIGATTGHTSVVINYLTTPAVTLSSITLDTTNVQTTFAKNDTFNYTGLIVTAHYSDSSSAVVTPTSVSSPNMSTTGQKTVTVTYEESDISKSASYNITVNSNPTLSWTAPTINTYSGTTLTSTDANSWDVTYNNGSGSITNPTYGQFSVKLGGTTIGLPYTWQPGDDGKTLCVFYNTLTTATTTVSIVQELNPINMVVPGGSATSDLTFNAACGGSGTADDGKGWTVTSDGTESSHDTNKGIHYGTNGASVQYIKLTSTAFATNSVTRVVVQASTASGVSATVSVKVGGSAFGGAAQSLTTSNASYTFTGDASGTIEVLITKPQSATKAIYCKGVAVTYTTSGTTQNIANVAGHEDAQRAVVKFAKAFNSAMDTTNMCTANMSSAWSSATSAWNTFLSEASALGSTKEAYAKNLIKYATAQWTDDTDDDFSYCLERALATYEYCVANHGQTAFMSEVRSGSINPHVNPVSLFGNNTSNIVAIIVIVSMVSMTAIGGYFFLRSRKED